VAVEISMKCYLSHKCARDRVLALGAMGADVTLARVIAGNVVAMS
jgi:hypothetical protein